MRTQDLFRALGLWLITIILPLSTHADFEEFAPGYTKLGYSVPAVGSYQLPVLGQAHDGRVINEHGTELSLHQVFGGRYVLMAFIYSRCDDVNGCPLSSYVFYQIKAEMERDPVLAQNLSLVSLSFDPEYDTAEVLSLYANNFKPNQGKSDWQFLSTSSVSKLEPILQAYGQDIQREVSLNGEQGGYSHILRVFLIDPDRDIRNIYSVAFLHKDLLLNDVKTLLHEQHSRSAGESVSSTRFSIIQPGDDKTGYESGDYKTHARALKQRRGESIDLLAHAKKPSLGLPALPVPENNPLTREKVALGRKLFFDRRLSLNDTFSCAMCHVPEQGFTSNELETAVGIEGRSVRRNSPTLYNVGYAELLFHDGREYTLEQQVWGPLLAKNEMGNPSVGSVIRKISNLSDYEGLFEAAFAGKAASMETVGQALASYQRSLVSGDSAFDRWYFGNDQSALSKAQVRGFRLFTGKAGCATCHHIGSDAALFTDHQLHNTGMGYRESMGIREDSQRIVLAPGVFVDVSTDVIDSVGSPAAPDVGQYEVTENPAHRWKYKTPGLRNINLTAPYMHNGSLGTLMDVVEFYDQGGIANELLDPAIRPLDLSRQEKDDLVSFLNALQGSDVEVLVSDAFAAPIGDTGIVKKKGAQ